MTSELHRQPDDAAQAPDQIDDADHSDDRAERIDGQSPAEARDDTDPVEPDGSEVEEIPEPKLPSPEFEREDGTSESPEAEYRELPGPLYDGPPTAEDVRQGELGDCYAMAPLASVADRRPDIIEDRIKDAGDGRADVRLTDPKTGDDQTITVDRTAPHATTEDGYLHHCHVADDDGATWPAAAEKALATTEDKGYDRLDQGGNDDATAAVMERFTGYNSDIVQTRDLSDENLLAAVREAQQENRPMACGIDGMDEDKPGAEAHADLIADRDLYADHAYAIKGATDDGRIELYNPHGPEGLQPESLTPAELRQLSPALISMSDRPIQPKDDQ